VAKGKTSTSRAARLDKRGEDAEAVADGQGNGKAAKGAADSPTADSRHRNAGARAGSEIAHRWSTEDKRLALSQVVLEGGNVRRAASALQRMGTPIPHRTIADWKRNEAALYAEVQREILPQLDAGLVEQLEQGIRLSLNNHAKGAKRLGRDIEDPEKIATRDVSTANRNEAVAAATLLDKRQILMNKPTQIEHRQQSSAEIARELKSMGVRFDVDGPIVDAEVVEPDQLPEGGGKAD
jgi:hypothetical protein